MERADTGSEAHPSPRDLYRRAHEIEQLAKIIMDCTAAGSFRADQGRAERMMKKIGAIAGGKDSEA